MGVNNSLFLLRM